VIIDFSIYHAVKDNLEAALKHLKPIVIGSTGHSSEQKRAIEAAAKYIPVLFSPNFSLGMGLCFQAAHTFASHLKGHCHIDIIEVHHHQKKDIPSGTALALAHALEYGQVCQDMSIQSPRPKDSIVIHSIRSGETIGEHTIIFNCDNERIELKHQIFSRDAFARGALKSAKFLSKKTPGLYTFQDVFEEK
jgi:4-hydroxy-tetrahydrodipicolinate reductase